MLGRRSSATNPPPASMFCRVKRQVPSLFASVPAPADRKTEKKEKTSSSSPGRGGFLGRAFRAYAQRRTRRGRGLQVVSDEHLGPADHDPAAEMEKQWLVESEASDGALDPEGWGLVRAAAPPAHYA